MGGAGCAVVVVLLPERGAVSAPPPRQHRLDSAGREERGCCRKAPSPGGCTDKAGMKNLGGGSPLGLLWADHTAADYQAAVRKCEIVVE
eukprot:5634901-Alexandrium_andersonii.AAC.1